MPEIISAVIIDDEPIACENLQHILASFISRPVKVIGTANSTADGEALIRRCRPDVVFLDIELPDENGFAFLARITPFDFEVIFTSAYDAYAVKAFRMNALDYILKPINIDELDHAVRKAAEKIAYKDYFRSQPAAPPAEAKAQKANILLRAGNEVEIVETANIIYLAADWSYSTVFFMKEGAVRQITMSYSIAEYEATLPGNFFRVHKSYLVNTAYIRKIIKGQAYLLDLGNGIQLPVSRRRHADLLAFLESAKQRHA